MTTAEFETFFEEYAKNVDHADQHEFWQLSDAIITALIKKNIPDPGPQGIIVDAGGGTGRWTVNLLKNYTSSFLILDLSEDMLAKAKINVTTAGVDSRVKILKGDMTDMADLEAASIDHAISIYSPISFIDDPAQAIRELYRVLKPGGRAFVMGHGYYNALASKINNYHAEPHELLRLCDEKIVKWAPHVPELTTFSKERFETLFTEAGFKPLATYGVPIFAQPGPEDFDPGNVQKSGISKALSNPDFFEAVFKIEMKFNGESTIANRGMNLFSIAEKQ